MVTDTGLETHPAVAAPAASDSVPYDGATPRGNVKNRFGIAFDVVAAATANLGDREREAIRWLAQFGRSKNLSRDEIGAKLRKADGSSYSGDSVYQALTGRREPGQHTNFVTAIEKLREVEEARAGQVQTGFIETRLTRRIFDICRKAFLRRKIAFIWGESQIGKTWALRDGYAPQHNHGETVYVRMPTGGTLDSFQRELAIVLGIPTGNRGEDLRRRLIGSFDDRMLLIVDEAHEALSEHYSAKRGVRTLNFIREIHDRCGCGIVLAATSVFRDAMLRGPHARSLRQLWLRGLPPLQLPATPSKADLDTFARAYLLGPAPTEAVSVRVSGLNAKGMEATIKLEVVPAELEARVIRDFGLGRWCTILAEASDLARERRKPIAWGAVVSAWHNFETCGELPDDSEEGGAS